MKHPGYVRLTGAALAVMVALSSLSGSPLQVYATSQTEGSVAESLAQNTETGTAGDAATQGESTDSSQAATTTTEAATSDANGQGSTSSKVDESGATGTAGTEGSGSANSSAGTADKTGTESENGAEESASASGTGIDGTENAAAEGTNGTNGTSSTALAKNSTEVTSVGNSADDTSQTNEASLTSAWDSAVVLDDGDDGESSLMTASVEDGSDNGETLKKLTETEESYSYKAAEKTGENPLKIKKGLEVTAVAQNELLLYQNLKHSNAQNTAVVFDNYINGKAPIADWGYRNEDKNNWSHAINQVGAPSAGNDNRTLSYNFDKAYNFNAEGYDSQENTKEYSAVKAVACDPFGTGRDGCVAYVGLDCTGQSHAEVVTWLYDYKNGKSSEVIKLATLNWTEIDKTFTDAQIANFVAITAGNYNGAVNETDGYGFATDSVVVYAPSSGGDSKKSNGLVELQWQQDPATHQITLKKQSAFSTSLLHVGYGYGDNTWAYDMSLKDKLACELATGDLDSDGIEDLAVLSYCGDSAVKQYGDATLYVPYLSVSMGSTDQNILENKTGGEFFEKSGGRSDNAYLWDTARSPGMSIGDANGDGIQEIAVAGIHATQATTGSNPNSHLKDDKLWKSTTTTNTVVGIYQVGASNTLQTLSFNTSVETNKWKSKGAHASDSILERSGVAFIALDGQYTQEQLFIDGSIYEFESNTAILKTRAVKTAKYFDEADNGVGSESITNTYIQSVAVGNFDHNFAGREQVIFVIGMKASGKHEDALAVLAMGGEYKNDSTVTDTVTMQKYEKHTGIYDNGYEGREYYLNHCEGSDIHEKFSCCVVAVDIDDDGLKIKYSQMNYLESDAEVQAVIQVAPEFGGLRQYGLASATSYKVTGSYTYETNNSHTEKAELGGILGVSADFEVVKWDLRVKVGYQASWVKGTSKSDTQTYTATFTATNQNLVVLRRNPFYRYVYDVSYEDTDEKGNKVTRHQKVTYDVGQAPYYVQLSVEDYNSLVDSYNAFMRKKKAESKNADYSPLYLEKITESCLDGNAGNPWKYQTQLGGSNIRNDYYVSSNTWSKYGALSNSPSWIQLGYAAGSTEASLTDVTLNKKFSSTTSGVAFSVEDTFSFKCGPVVGVYGSGAILNTTGSSETTGSGSGISTRVGNIDKAAILKAKAAAEGTIDKYSFQWCFAGGELKIGHKEGDSGNEDAYVPFLHHIIKLDSLTAPLAPLKLDAIKLSSSKQAGTGAKKLTLTWTTPKDDGSGREFLSADKMNYAIYQRNASEDDEWKLVVGDLVRDDCTWKMNSDGTCTLEYEITPEIDTADGNIYQYAVRSSLLGKENTTESINSNYKTLAFMETESDTGEISYLHIKYSDDGGKTFTGNDGADIGSWMGSYTDHKKEASAIVSDYKWIQIKGDTGAAGDKGDKGETGEKGDKGDTGSTGEKGDKGDTGAAGDKGDKGDTGEKGEKGDKGDTGAAGRGIETTQIDASGHLIITYSDGTSEDAGLVQAYASGDEAYTGAIGRSIETTQIDEDGHLIITYSDGTSEDAGLVQESGTGATGAQGVKGEDGATGEKGDTGATGAQGETGAAGRGIETAKLDENGHLIITYSDGTSEDAGAVQGYAKRDPLVYVALAISILALLLCLYLLYSQRYSSKSMRRMWKKMAGLRDDDIGDDE